MSARLPAIPQSQWSPEQHAAAAALVAGPRGALRGPFVPLLHSPQLLQYVQQLGEYLRFNSRLPQRLRELAILTTARHWSQTYEWHTHAAIAAQLGASAALLQALAEQSEPTAADDDERAVIGFCRELHQHHAVTEPTFAQVQRLGGEAGVVELCGLCGYYALLAMVMNVAQTPLPAGASVPFEPPTR